MALSASSLGVFVFLLPGLMLRCFIYQGSLVKRAILSANPIFAALSVLLFALAVHFAAAAAAWLGAAAVCRLQLACPELHLVFGAGPVLEGGAGGRRLLAFLAAHPWALMAYLGYAVLVAFVLAKLFSVVARVNGSAARLL
ncbi:MAG: hypothetical protein GY948_21995 [Alphaproteobacteria bacterium]|nr:hypothetical protein [Alphaproteobacteria bacterium]